MTIETLESEFAEALTTISSGLGIAAERIFGIFVSAQVMIGIIDIVSIFILVTGALLSGWYIRKSCVKLWRDDDGKWEVEDNEAHAIWVPVMGAAVSAFIISCITDAVGNAMVKICCPEYTAMQEIITLVIP